MLQELRQESFSRIQPLLTGERVNMEVKGVAAGNNPGWIFVEDRNNPETALVFSHGQMGFYFLGREDNPRFLGKIHNTITDLRPRLLGLGVNDFEYSGTSAQWDRTLAEIFADKKPQVFQQHVYTNPNLRNTQAPLLEGSGDCQVEEICGKLMNRDDVDTAMARRVLLEWWDSLDLFLARGAGYCVISAGQVVSMCYTSFVAPGEWELGVDTHNDFRQRGFAKLATAAMLRRCQEEGVNPYWDCSETNTPSWKLATGLGLKLAFTYPVYWFSL